MLPRKMHILLAHTPRRKMSNGSINMQIKENVNSNSQENLTFTSSHVTNTIEDRPWMNYYLTVDEYLEIVKVAYEDTFGGSKIFDGKCHPEDLYSNVSCVMEIVTNTLCNLSNIRSDRPVRGIIKSI
jgi:hypothetical protein